MSMRELARVTGIPRSTTHRLVTELVAWGALEQGPSGLRLGVKLFELGTMSPSHTMLRDVALPFAHNLHEVTGLTVNIAVRDGMEIVYVEKITTRSLRVPHSRLGGRASLHATGLGKAILAFSDEGLRKTVLESGLAPRTSKTLVEPAALAIELARVRETKLAYDVEESRLGLFCVAAPILVGNLPIAAISVTGATALSVAQHYAPAVRTTALGITHSMTSRQA